MRASMVVIGIVLWWTAGGALAGGGGGGLALAAALDGAEGGGEVKVVSDPNVFLFKLMRGSVEVRAAGSPVEGADVLGVVRYHGSSLNTAGVQVGDFSGATDASGTLAFVYGHDAFGASGGSSVATLPGYHEIQITAVAPGAGGEILEGNVVVRYWVRPATPT